MSTPRRRKMADSVEKFQIVDELKQTKKCTDNNCGGSSTGKGSPSCSSSSSTFLNSWVTHQDASFHNFSPEEAFQIQESLVKWYRENRRKLPWRGDPAPWDGSTVNFVERSKSKQNGNATKNAGTVGNGTQKKLDSYFTSSKQSDVTKDEASKKKDDEPTVVTQEGNEKPTQALNPPPQMFPVTGYGVWVSEIMLQQTRVEAVIPYWVKWMTSFPTVKALAAASPEQVNAHWAGLGFYRRARLLHEAAQFVSEELGGELPQTVEGLLVLPGVGRYTASAIASIAFNVTVPVVDGNVCRVLSRLRAIAQNVKDKSLKDQFGWTLAAQIVEARPQMSRSNGDNESNSISAGEVNQALMELGATYCAPSGTGVEEGDPLKDFYWSTRLGKAFVQEISTRKSLRFPDYISSDGRKRCRICAPGGIAQALESLSTSWETNSGSASASAAATLGHTVFPLAPEKLNKKEEVYAVAVITQPIQMSKPKNTTKVDGTDAEENLQAYLLVKRPEKGLLAGQWEFPSALLWTSESEGKSGENVGSHDEIENEKIKVETPKKQAKRQQKQQQPQKKSGTKRKDMSDQIPTISKLLRKRALDMLLKEIGDRENDHKQKIPAISTVKRFPIGDSSIEHVFSHVRHTLWVEHGCLDTAGDNGKVVKSRNNSPGMATRTTKAITSLVKGRQVRWMLESDMGKVGVTSGVKKILKAVKEHVVHKAGTDIAKKRKGAHKK